ncbi:MAG: dipeptidyl aminopeptidase/acylaminoacyl peptidase [Paraglaciecola sp.]|jgi:dipeptidyl aminopeptidase/acylaminoacyl peptidase
MTRKKITFAFLFLISTIMLQAQQDLSYQTPPKAIADLIDAPLTPSTRISPDYSMMLWLDRPSLPGIEEVGQEELRLAGIRINPKTNGSSRAYYYNGMTLRAMQGVRAPERKVQGLPAELCIENVSWSPDNKRVLFTNTLENGIELWTVDAATAQAKKLTKAIINDAMSGSPYRFFRDGKTILYKSNLANRGPVPIENAKPFGPTIQNNEGDAAPVRTYQDLLKNKHDEALFTYYTSSQLMKMDLETGKSIAFSTPGIIGTFSPSPDGEYVMVSRVKTPFSYIVPYSRFPFSVSILSKVGKIVKEVTEIPAAENIPKGFGATREGARSFTWRSDQPAMLYWVEAQDGGDPKQEAEIRDRLFVLKAPFTGKTMPVIDFKLRYGGVTWGNDGLAIADEWWWQNRQIITSQWNPANPKSGKNVIWDRSWEDTYNDPGGFEMTRNEFGRSILMTTDEGKSLFLTGTGASPEGNRPFVDKYNIETRATTRLWRSEAPFYERPLSIFDAEQGLILTVKESNEVQPNFYVRNLKTGDSQQITYFPNPYEALKGLQKELVQYKRDDGVELTGTLYLPPNYDKEKDGPLPCFMWAYPREFKSKKAAGQVKDSPYEFTRVWWGSPILWVTQGYAVFDDFGMPIIGEGKEEPNETFVKQLTSGAEAAINELARMGVVDPKRVGVGGHSYGAFMTANLLAHTDLFAAGIARSGAYNRTLTPFGFQSEERTFWEAPETYFKMSPFMHADNIKEPLLLIHGEADNNSGTYPMQTERFYAALKGHGATCRMVMLPHESHGYRAKESVMHMAWEMDTWLDKYVKNAEVKEKKMEVKKP